MLYALGIFCLVYQTRVSHHVVQASLKPVILPPPPSAALTGTCHHPGCLVLSQMESYVSVLHQMALSVA